MPHWERILHISDLHERVALDGMSKGRIAKVNGGKASRYRVLGQKLTKAFDQIRGEHPIHFVCFTGDVADWGLAEEYTEATSRIDSILEVIVASRDRLFLVPFNHDVNRRVAENTWKEMRKLSLARIDLSQWMAGEISPYGAEPTWRDEIMERSASFWQWVEKDLGLCALAPKNSRHGRLGYCVDVLGLGLPTKCASSY